MKILKDISLKTYNTFGIDVTSKAFAEIFSEDELIILLNLPEWKNKKKLVIGGGSNILFTDNFDGLVIKISIPGIEIINEDQDFVYIKAGAGVNWNDLVNFCVDKNYGGIENLSLIPGTVGAAPIQNIGAYGQELKEVFYSLSGILIEKSEEKVLYKNDCKFGYRESIFKNELKDKFIITYVILRLYKKPVINLSYDAVRNEIEKLKLENITIKEISKIVSEIRIKKLPDPKKIGNAGSFFKNPEVDEKKFMELKNEFPELSGRKTSNQKYKLAAGWLIEKCGWKGKQIKNSGCHTNQSLVLVNYGNATGSEILELAEQIENSVMAKFGITLQKEVNIY